MSISRNGVSLLGCEAKADFVPTNYCYLMYIKRFYTVTKYKGFLLKTSLTIQIKHKNKSNRVKRGSPYDKLQAAVIRRREFYLVIPPLAETDSYHCDELR